MNIDPSELREERLRHPREEEKIPRSASAATGNGLVVISLTALLLGLGLTFFLYSLNQKLKVRETQLQDQLAQLSKRGACKEASSGPIWKPCSSGWGLPRTK